MHYINKYQSSIRKGAFLMPFLLQDAFIKYVLVMVLDILQYRTGPSSVTLNMIVRLSWILMIQAKHVLYRQFNPVEFPPVASIF